MNKVDRHYLQRQFDFVNVAQHALGSHLADSLTTSSAERDFLRGSRAPVGLVFNDQGAPLLAGDGRPVPLAAARSNDPTLASLDVAWEIKWTGTIWERLDNIVAMVRALVLHGAQRDDSR